MESDARPSFAALLREHRVARSLSQETLAEAAGLSRDAIGLLERGARRSPRRETVVLLARALKLSADERARLLAAASVRHASTVATPPGSVPAAALPPRLTSFIGREREIAEVREMLGAKRLVTLSGPGGIGKTSLALEVAAELQSRFADGVALVDLAALADGDLVPHAIAAVLGVREQPSEPILTTLGTALGTTQRLFVLDNCEHLLLSCARVVEALLRACPRLRILATSREPLRIGAEVIWRVPSLSLPDDDTLPQDELARSEAVRLFVERAGAIRSGFALTTGNALAVAEVCRRLDGIPLAIELAAARVVAMTPEQIAGHLSDRFRLLTSGSRTALPRHQTLRATLDWSYDLLTPAEQMLLRRLAVFAGGGTSEAAETVVDPGGTDGLDVLVGIDSLVGQSLLEVTEREGEPRFTLLETTREYALERLSETGEAAGTRARHAAHYLALIELRLRADELGPLEPERDNLRAALRWFEETGDVAASARLIDAMSKFWRFNGPPGEISGWLARLRALAGFASAPDDVRALALIAEGGVELRRDAVATRACSEQLLALGRAAANPSWVQVALQRLAWASLELGDVSRAEGELADRLALGRELGDSEVVVNTLIYLGDAARLRGEDDLARARYEESLACVHSDARRFPSVAGFVSFQLRNLGHLALRRGDLAEAESSFRESMAGYESLGVTLGQVEGLVGFAALAAARGDAERGARLLGAVDAALPTIGVKLYFGDRFEQERTLRALHATLSDTAFAAAQAAGQAMTLERVLAYAREDERTTGRVTLPSSQQ